MAKFTTSIVLFTLMVFSVMAPTRLRAEPLPAGGDYAQVSVPDVSQAVSFFRNVLDCQAIDASTSSRNSALMVCESGQILEFVKAPAGKPQTHATPLRFVVNDVTDADQWLESAGAHVIGEPVRATSGPDAGRTMINFSAPWGLQLQLVGSSANPITSVP